MAKAEEWYIFRLNEDKDWVKMKKVCKTKKEAVDYACSHNYQHAMISNTPTLYRKEND